MEQVLKSLRAELNKATNDVVKRNLRNSIYFVMKAIEQVKMLAKKAERKLKQEEKEQAAAKKAALAEIEKQRHRIK